MNIDPNRHIAHLDLDSFFVSVEQLMNPGLKGKPILIGGTGDRAVVASCSYEARQFGIHNAMPMKIAKRLCSHAVIIRADAEQYSRYSTLVTEIIKDTVPLFEKASIDEFYLDLTGMDKFFGCSMFTAELKEKVFKESGLPCSYGLASNKLVSKVATNEIKPNGQIEIPFGNEKNFLAPLSVRKIPGIGVEISSKLAKMGITRVKLLSEMPKELLQNFLGKTGIDLWRKANGIDRSPVIPFHEQKSMSTENTFEQDTIDIRFLHGELVRMTESLAFELRKANKLTGCISVKIRYTDFETHTKQKCIPYTNSDHLLIQSADEIFNTLFQRRQLIRMVGLRFTNLIPGNHQIRLFDDTEELINLYKAIDSVKRTFGEKIVVRAVGI